MTQSNAPDRTEGDDLPSYLAVDPPEDVDPTDYDTAQRRAAVATRIMKAGSPNRLTYSDLGDHYDVHPTTISRDVDAVAADVARHLGYRAELKVVAIFEKAVEDLLDEDPREAWLCAKEFSEWLEDRGALERAPDRHVVDKTVRNVGDSESYTVIDDDEAEEYIDAEFEEVDP